MKFSGNTQEIMEGLSAVTHALSAKPAKPVFDGVHVQCDGTTLSLTCSDGTMSIRWTGSATVAEPGEAIIKGKLFADLMRKLSSTTAKITADERAATITYNKSRSQLAVIAGTYPEMREITNPAVFTIPAMVLKDMITHILPAIAVENPRIILTGGVLDVTPEGITVVSLDGFRLALKRYSHNTGISGNVRAIIPRKTLLEMSRILPSSDDPVTIHLGQDAIRADIGSTTITSTLLSGEYVDYHKIIPTTFSTRIRADVRSLGDTLDRVSMFAREGKTNLVQFGIHDNTLAVSSQSDTSNIAEELDCDQEGNNLAISFNSSYISDAIRTVPDDYISMNFNSSSAPVVISPVNNTDWLFLILPVRTH